MTALKKKVPHSIISCFFLMYFVILFAERLQSLIRAATADQLFMDAFEGAASMIVSLSVLSAVVLLAFCSKPFWKSLAGKAEPDYNMMTVTAGVILVSGMIHTEYARKQKPLRAVVFADLPYRIFNGDTGCLQALHADERDSVSRY